MNAFAWPSANVLGLRAEQRLARATRRVARDVVASRASRRKDQHWSHSEPMTLTARAEIGSGG